MWNDDDLTFWFGALLLVLCACGVVLVIYWAPVLR
jgi:hypothetical protein